MAIIYYDKLYRQKGIRRIEHFLKPRILDANEFIFPVGSVLNWFKVDEKPILLTKDYGYLKNLDRALVRTIFDYELTDVRGRILEKSFIIPAWLKENNNACKEFRFLKPGQTIKINDKMLFINNFGPINAKYKYPTQLLRRYNIFVNTYKAVISNLFREFPERHKFILLDMPTSLPTRIELNKFSSVLKKQYIDLLPTYQHLILLDLWKFLTPELRKESIINLIPEKEFKNVTLLLCIDNKLIMIGLAQLAGMVSEYNIEVNTLKPKRSEMFKKMFYIFISKLITEPAMTEHELEQLEAELNNKKVNESDNSKALNINETKIINSNINGNINSERKVFNNAIETLRNKDKENIINEIKNLPNELEDDIDENEIDDILTETEDDDYETLEDNDNIEEFEPEDNHVVEGEPVTSLLEKSVLKDTSPLFKHFNNSDEIKEENYNYRKVIEELDVKFNEKLITKSNVNKFKDNYLKHMNSKDPYGSNQKVIELLDDNKDNYTIDKDKSDITDNIVVLDKTQNKNIINTITNEYLERQYKKDIVRVVNSLQNTNILVESHTVESNDNLTNSLETHNITVRTLDNKTHNLKMILPKINDDGTMHIGNQTYRLRMMRFSFPIVKIGIDKVKLTSYYGRLFISKAKFKKDDIGYYLLNKISKLYEQDIIKNLVALPSENKISRLPLLYSQLSRYMKSFTYKNRKFNFSYSDRGKLLEDTDLLNKIENNRYILIGLENKTPILIDFNNDFYKYENNGYKKTTNILEELDIDINDGPIEFASIAIFRTEIPIVLVLSFYMGLLNLMKTLKIKYEILKSDSRVPNSIEYYTIKFKDCKLKIFKDHKEGDMIFAGLKAIQKTLSNYDLSILNDKNKQLALFSALNYSLVQINEIKLLETMFMDPMTITLAKSNNLPISFKGLLLRACEILVDDSYSNPQDMSTTTIKGYERIAGMFYKELIDAIKNYNNKSVFSKIKLTINPYDLLVKINEDSTTVLVDDLNPISTMKQTEDVSYLGEGGFNKISMGKDTRAYNESEIGIISEAAKDSGDVGITAYLTANPNIEDLRGKTKTVEKPDISSIFSTTTLLTPFALTDDPKRTNFLNIQSSHIIPVKNMRPNYVRTGYEAIIPIRTSSKFVITAEENGKVLSVSKNELVVEYSKKGKRVYKLKSWTSKEEASSCYTHHMVTSLVQNDTFIKDDTLVYDKAFFEPDIFNNKRVIYKQGDVVTVALLEDPETFEDSAGFSKQLDSRLSTTVTKVRSIVIDKTDDVENLVKINDKLDPETTLLTIVNPILKSYGLSQKTLDLLKEIKTKSPVSKVRGVVTKIEVKYNCKVNELSRTLQSLVSITDKELKSNTGFTGDVTDGSYSIDGVPLMPDQVEIKIYIDVENGMGLGDKAIFGNQLKFTVGEVFNYDLTAEDGTLVDATFSSRSIYNRIVNSATLTGTTGMVIEQLTKKAVELYFKK